MKQLFNDGNLSIGKANLRKIVEQFKNHPMYIQLFCFFLWQELQDNAWTDGMINTIERSMIDQKYLEYQTLWDNLSINQSFNNSHILPKRIATIYLTL